MPLIECSYYYQIDNPSGEGFRECCGTSNAAMLNQVTNGWLDREAERLGREQPEQIYLDRLRDFGDTTDHGANTACLESFGIISSFHTDLTNQDFMRSIDLGISFVMGFKYKRAGHIVLGVGYQPADPKMALPWRAVFHDPFGKRRGTSDTWISNEPTSGRLDSYVEDSFNDVFCGDIGNGYGRLVHSVRGKATGL